MGTQANHAAGIFHSALPLLMRMDTPLTDGRAEQGDVGAGQSAEVACLYF